VPPLERTEIEPYLSQVSPEWRVKDDKVIRREFSFKSFSDAMAFVNKVADLAEAEGHHPDFHVHYRNVIVELWTHAIGGLSENDFILAAKIDAVY
jgi:4a-hydroxytetrahydrobiopterin dehydratase